MKDIFKTFHPTGFHTINAYLFVSNPEELIDFLINAFWAIELSRSLTPNGKIGNCIMKIGDSCFMISQARGEFEGMRTSFYLYVNNVDEVFENALKHGAGLSFSPDNMDYGDRQAGVIDPAGNYWWISTRLKEEPYED